jgi:hypothetical protein
LISNHFRDTVGGPDSSTGGSNLSLAFILFNNLAVQSNIEDLNRAKHAGAQRTEELRKPKRDC